MRENAGDSHPVKGMPSYKFEEDFPRHIREALVIILTGSTLFFFENLYVCDWLNSLEPRHHPIYRKKLVQLICCIIDITTKEVSIYKCKRNCQTTNANRLINPHTSHCYFLQMFQIITELFLECCNSFTYSNSDYWWEGCWKINFAAAVGNFMPMHYKFRNRLVLANVHHNLWRHGEIRRCWKPPQVKQWLP